MSYALNGRGKICKMSSLVKMLIFNVFNFRLLEIRGGCGNLWRLPHLFLACKDKVYL